LPASAQLEEYRRQNTGPLNAWTRSNVERYHEDPSREDTYLRTVRAAEQDGFDRLVFEFEGPIPDFAFGHQRSSKFYESDAGKERITIAGRGFLYLQLVSMIADERQLKSSEHRDFMPRGRLHLPSLLEIKDYGLDEGYWEFLVGLASRKPFRVTELSNPARLVIDIQH
jgi:hypothetical protein